MPRTLILAVALSLVACTTRGTAVVDAGAPIVIDAYTDLVCPWCFIGTERLDRAVAQSGVANRVVIRHHAFLLQPQTPAEGYDTAEMLRAKTGREPKEMFAAVEGVARSSGIALDLSKRPRTWSTVPSHVLLKAAAAKGTQRALERDIFRANFLEGANISDAAVLTKLAAPHGFTADEVTRLLADTGAEAAVRTEAAEANARGIFGVPYFVFNGGQAMSGAQSEEALRAAISAAAR